VEVERERLRAAQQRACPSESRLATPGLVATLVCLCSLNQLAISIFLPAMPAMASALGADSLAVKATLSVYLLVYAASLLVHGPLSDRFGRRPVVLSGRGHGGHQAVSREGGNRRVGLFGLVHGDSRRRVAGAGARERRRDRRVVRDDGGEHDHGGRRVRLDGSPPAAAMTTRAGDRLLWRSRAS
jgi:hypothetical protein